MNNTSLILLITVGKKRLLFPGDAQIETWEYALEEASNRRKMLKELAGVDVYKVGHHGSLNATPLSLWAKFKKKRSSSKSGRKNGRKNGAKLTSLLSTMKNVHGARQRKTEVPRSRLVKELKRESDLRSTEEVKKEKLCDVLPLDL
jgi:hypothetical protein